MMSPLSRRELLFALGGGAAAAALVWKSASQMVDQSPTAGPSHRATEERYVDHEGWIVTVADKGKIGSTPPAAP